MIASRGRIKLLGILFLAVIPACRATANIHHAVLARDAGNVKAILAEKPELAKAKDKYAVTPLHSAVVTGDKEIVELLLAKRARVNARNNIGSTPLQIAAHKGYTEVVECLLKNGGTK
jgi:ankyrin repeat protein